MASINKRPDGQWRARWREYPGGPQRSKHFARKVDASRFLVELEHQLQHGTYVGPAAGKTTLNDHAAAWLARMKPTWRAATATSVEKNLRRHILPVLGHRPVSTIRKTDVEALYASLRLAPTTVALVHQHLGQLLSAAVEDGLAPRNVAIRARLPKREPAKAKPVPLDVVERIAAALPAWMRVVVPLGVGVGLRQAEVTGLTLPHIEFLRRTLRVQFQLDCADARSPALAPLKTSASYRTVPLATFVIEALAAHLQRCPVVGDEVGELILRRPDGRPLDDNRFGREWRNAVKAAGVPGLRFHDLRHTFASTLLSRGVSVKAVADWLGHASPVVTLTTYAHLMPADEDVARTVLDAALAGAAEDQLRTADQAARL